MAPSLPRREINISLSVFAHLRSGSKFHEGAKNAAHARTAHFPCFGLVSLRWLAGQVSCIFKKQDHR